MTAETVPACTLGLEHHWHPDPTYVDEDAPPMDEWPDGWIYHWRSAERCCYCKTQRPEMFRKTWSGPWNPEPRDSGFTFWASLRARLLGR